MMAHFPNEQKMGDHVAESECPFPEIADHLGPYIKTREEVTAIRQSLQKALPLNLLDLSHPVSAAEKTVDVSALSGVRKAYWRALHAHKLAQARYDALKAELNQPPSSPATSEIDPAGLLTENYLPLLRQKEKHRKLKVIEKAYLKVSSTGSNALSESLEDAASSGLGDPPNPPSTSIPQPESSSDSDPALVRLKRAILSVKQQLDQHKEKISQAGEIDLSQADDRAKFRALQSTHKELTAWMEEQLSQIGDSGNAASSSSAAAETSSGTNGDIATTTPPQSDENEIPSTDELEDFYEQYLDARQRLLETLQNPPTLDLSSPTQAPGRKDSNSLDSSSSSSSKVTATAAMRRVTLAETLLPYIPELISVKDRETALRQQGDHIRGQVAASTGEHQRLIARLADESHLVQPGASRGNDWARAASLAGEESVEVISQSVKTGQGSVKSGRATLDSIRNVPESLDGIMSDGRGG